MRGRGPAARPVVFSEEAPCAPDAMRLRALIFSAAALAALLAGAAWLAWERGLTWNHPDPERFPALGIDVSRHQGRIDWQTVAAQPRIRFAYLKATEGTGWVDPTFARNWAAARREGLRVGAYHYFGFCTPGADQARHFLSVLPSAADMLPPALDVESDPWCPTPPSREVLLAEIDAWCSAVEAATGKRPILYVTGESYRALLAGSGRQNLLWVRSLLAEPRPEGGEAWAFWQWHARGRLPGVAGIVDLDAYRSELGPLEGL